MLTITVTIDTIEKLNKWLNEFPKEVVMIQSISEHKFITDWESNKSYIENCVKENIIYEMIHCKTDNKYACIIPNYIHKMTFEINNFTFEVIDKIIELRDLEIEYELYDCDKNKVEYQDLFDWKEDLLVDLCEPKEISTIIAKYCDSFVIGIVLMILALIFYAFG